MEKWRFDELFLWAELSISSNLKAKVQRDKAINKDCEGGGWKFEWISLKTMGQPENTTVYHCLAYHFH